MPPSHGTALEPPPQSALVAHRPYDKLGDLWWVPEVHRNDELLIGVSHRVPTSPRDRQPVIWRSFQQLGQPSQERRLYPLSYLNVWRQAWGDVNVFRTLCRFATGNEEPVLLGPFCLDDGRSPRFRPRRPAVLTHGEPRCPRPVLPEGP